MKNLTSEYGLILNSEDVAPEFQLHSIYYNKLYGERGDMSVILKTGIEMEVEIQTNDYQYRTNIIDLSLYSVVYDEENDVLAFKFIGPDYLVKDTTGEPHPRNIQNVSFCIDYKQLHELKLYVFKDGKRYNSRLVYHMKPVYKSVVTGGMIKTIIADVIKLAYEQNCEADDEQYVEKNIVI